MSDAARSPKPAEWRRWTGILLRTAHLASVVALGASLLGAPEVGWGGPASLMTGLILLIAELADGRVRLDEAAGAIVVLKLLAVAWLVVAGGVFAVPVFWGLMVVSAISAHAPRPWRHWRPGR